jgi:hypothetical protein
MLSRVVENAFRGMALARAADAMLRALGGQEITLLFPAIPLPDDPAAQLGLADPGVEEVKLAPVILRNLPFNGGETRRRIEFLMPAQAIAEKMEVRQAATAQAFFEAALGIVHESLLLRIEKISAEFFAGTAYLYRVTAVE